MHKCAPQFECIWIWDEFVSQSLDDDVCIKPRPKVLQLPRSRNIADGIILCAHAVRCASVHCEACMSTILFEECVDSTLFERKLISKKFEI